MDGRKGGQNGSKSAREFDISKAVWPPRFSGGTDNFPSLYHADTELELRIGGYRYRRQLLFPVKFSPEISSFRGTMLKTAY